MLDINRIYTYRRPQNANDERRSLASRRARRSLRRDGQGLRDARSRQELRGRRNRRHGGDDRFPRRVGRRGSGRSPDRGDRGRPSRDHGRRDGIGVLRRRRRQRSFEGRGRAHRSHDGGRQGRRFRSCLGERHDRSGRLPLSPRRRHGRGGRVRYGRGRGACGRFERRRRHALLPTGETTWWTVLRFCPISAPSSPLPRRRRCSTFRFTIISERAGMRIP